MRRSVEHIRLGSLWLLAAFAAACGGSAPPPARAGSNGQPVRADAAVNPDAFVLAVTWPPGLLPIARYTGAEWVNHWPASDERKTPVPALGDIPEEWLPRPIPRDWTLWLKSGGTAALSATGTARSTGGCSAPIVLTLDNGSSQVATIDETSAGNLAVNTGRPVERFRRITAADAEWARLQPAIEGAFRANEARVVEPKENPPGAPVIIDWVYRPSGDAAPIVYYFEAHKRTNPGAEEPRGFALWGWTGQDASGHWQNTGVAGRRIDADSNGLGSPIQGPLGVFRIRNDVFWVVAQYGYESMSWSVLQVTLADVRRLTTADGGGC